MILWEDYKFTSDFVLTICVCDIKKNYQNNISFYTEDLSDENNKVLLFFSALFARAFLQIARFEEKTAMSTDQKSNFAAVGDRNCPENP